MSGDWLAGLVVGSPVAVSGRYGAAATISKVERITATQVVVAEHGKYRRANGRQIGGDTWSSTFIFEPQRTHYDVAEAIRLRKQICEAVADKATTLRVLREMAAALAIAKATAA